MRLNSSTQLLPLAPHKCFAYYQHYFTCVVSLFFSTCFVCLLFAFGFPSITYFFLVNYYNFTIYTSLSLICHKNKQKKKILEMDHKKSQVGSSSSLTSQLFGSQESSSNDVLASIFPPSKGMGSWQSEPSGNQSWNNRKDNSYIHRDATYGSSASKERSSVYQQEGGQPCHLSSSLYYGGQDVYSKSQTSQNSTSYPTFKKSGGEDEPSGASRGNWWQGKTG